MKMKHSSQFTIFSFLKEEEEEEEEVLVLGW